jgi:hypothetical protein
MRLGAGSTRFVSHLRDIQIGGRTGRRNFLGGAYRFGVVSYSGIKVTGSARFAGAESISQGVHILCKSCRVRRAWRRGVCGLGMWDDVAN